MDCTSFSEMENYDDDPIVEVIPIIHSNQLEQSLNLFQYPLRRANCTDEHKILKCSYKPENEEVKLELNINTDSPNFDTGRAELIAHQVDGNETGNTKKEPVFRNEIVDRVFLQSLRTVTNCRKYAAVTFNGKEIHLTALKGIYQFRPHFPYMDSMKRKRDIDVNQDSEDEEAGPSTAQQVTVTFKSLDDNVKRSKEVDYKTLQARSAQEPWIECKWHAKDTPLSKVEKLKLFTENTEDIGQASNLTKTEYLRLLIPEDQEQAPLEPTLPSHLLSLHALRALPLLEQCRILLKDAQIIQFQQLLLLFAGSEGFSTESLLKTLPKVAVLVRGNWIVKSEVLYPADTFSAISGVPAELMCRARDYVLYLFTKNQYVERKKVSSILKIPSEEIKEIFTGISKLRRHNKEWELHLPADQDFINKHTDLVLKQNLFWEHRFHQLTEFLKDNRTQRRKSRSESKSFSEDGKTRNGLSVSSDNDSGTEKSNKSPVAVRKNKGVKLSNQIATDVAS